MKYLESSRCHGAIGGAEAPGQVAGGGVALLGPVEEVRAAIVTVVGYVSGGAVVVGGAGVAATGPHTASFL